MLTIRCIMMEKNELTLLEPWILYHSSLFGFENLTIIDNGSTCPEIHTLLDYYEKKGCCILRTFTTKQDFIDKGKIVKNIIQEWDKNNDHYDFAIPLDCDEFLAFFGNNILLEKEDIINQFQYLLNYDGTFLLHRILLNDPTHTGFFKPQIIRKSFFRPNTIVNLDNGYHEPQTIYDRKLIFTNFMYIHLHNRPNFSDLKKFSSEKLAPFVNISDLENLKNYTGIGSHLISDFFHSEEDYKNQYRNTGMLYLRDFIVKMHQLGCNIEKIFGHNENKLSCYTNIKKVKMPKPLSNFLVCFFKDKRLILEGYDELFYKKKYPDINNDTYYTIWPLVHFSNLGYHEGRISNAFASSPYLIIQ
ncbi:hypothetical protein JGUZn3_03140 [Entomobacter blattae]|uniref:Uncharacterized protein n=2 Tax=Entomobacter blattae TaxID=2762277 RepID=A0A7H1NP61_9PROT|nr:hypothetical protein JGUZn3_03140 [Entomobacter blattae]